MEKMAFMPRHQLTMPLTIFLADDISSTEKILLSEIIWLQNYNSKKYKKVYCQATNFYFRMILGYKSDRPVSDLITSLKNKGYIKELKYIKGDFRHLQYDFDKCFYKDFDAGIIKQDRLQ